MNAQPRIVAVIPALDEEGAIGPLLRAVMPFVAEAIVVDNGSRDRTAEVAAGAGARVVHEPRRGYGSACQAGIAAAAGADVLVFLDGDGSDDASRLPGLLAPILAAEADLVIGSRRLGGREAGAQPWHAVLGTRLCVGLMNALVGTRATDLGPFRVITVPALRSLGMRDRDYGWTVEMQIRAVRQGLRTVEVPVPQRRRSAGRSKVSGTLRGTLGAAFKILGTILRHGLLSPAGARPKGAPSPAAEDDAARREPRRQERRWLVAFTACGLLQTVCVLDWAWGRPATSRVAWHLATFGVAFASYLVALHASRRLGRRALAAALLLGAAWRGVLVTAPPLLSDDVYRYVWEGRIQLHGGNPYAWDDRPEAPRWRGLRDDVWEGVNHKGYTAIYPPLFLLASRLVVGSHDSVSAMKAFLAGCELLALGLLGLLLSRRGLPLERLLVLAWSPLALVEIAGSGHNEAFGMLWLVAALLALDLGRPLASAAFVTAGLLSKFLPGLIALAWVRRYRPWHSLVVVALAAAAVWPFLGARKTLLLSLDQYSRFWTFNETLFAPLAAALGHDAAVRVGALLALALALVLAGRRSEPATAAMAIVAATLLLSPNVLPWYSLWLLPLLVLRDEPALLLFTGTVALANLVYPSWQSGEPWRLAWGWRALEYAPCVLVWLLTGSSGGIALRRAGGPLGRPGALPRRLV